MLTGRIALCATAIAAALSATSASAAFFSYNLFYLGTGERMTLDRNTGNVTYDALQGATLRFDVAINEGDTTAYAGYPFTLFTANVGGGNLNFSFEPEFGQSSYVATGSGNACLQAPGDTFPTSPGQFQIGCGSLSYEARSQAGYAENFNGTLSGVTVTRQEGESTNYFYVIGYVPEPTTWALMLAGFGMVGYALRRRPRLSYAL